MSLQQGSIAHGTFQTHTPLNGVTATTTSNAIPCGGAKRITLAFTRANHAVGSSAFSVEGTLDGTTWAPIGMLPVAGTKTRADSVTLSADGTELHALDLEEATVNAIRVTVTETTDGTHTATCVVNF